MLREVGIKQIKKYPLGTEFIVNMCGEHWIDKHRNNHVMKLTKTDGVYRLENSKFKLQLRWKSDVQNLRFKVYKGELI